MTITALSGPVISFGTVMTSTSGTGILGQDVEHNEQRGPSVSDLGDALMDPRVAYAYQPGSGPATRTFGFYNNQGMVDYVPAAAVTNAFVPSSIVSTGVTTYSIPSSLGVSSAGVISTTIIAPETGKVSGTLLALDSTAAYLTFGAAGTIAVWNPAAGAGRCISITTSSSGDGGTFSIAGRDVYGFLMTEKIALSQGTTNSSGITMKTQKAFKYISAITNTTTPTSTGVVIGFTDTFGFPLYAPYAGITNNAMITATASQQATFVTGNMTIGLPSTATATSTTADVRGTYASSTAMNGTIRLQMICNPSAMNMAAVTSTNVAPLFGATQFSSV